MYHAPGTVARLSNGQKNLLTLFRCALNTEMKEENKISLEVLINQPLPQQPEAVAKIRYFCVSSIKGLISSENLE